jgi:hypothetical protein
VSHFVTNVIAGMEWKGQPSANISVAPMMSQRVGAIAASMNVTVTWKLSCMVPNAQLCMQEITKLGFGVNWRGILAEKVGAVHCCGRTDYPAYEYTDVIGTGTAAMKTRVMNFDDAPWPSKDH